MSPDSGLASRRSKKSAKTKPDNKTVIRTETTSKRITKKIKLPYSFGPIGLEVYQRTYSRLKGDGKHETWEETVRRVVDGNLALVDDRFHEPDEREKLYNLILKMDMLPAGRHLWATGVPGRQYLSNCHSAAFLRKDLTQHFTFTFDELMKGGGVGSNYSNRYISIYPPVFDKVELHIVCNPSHPNIDEFKQHLSPMYDHLVRDRYVIDDSREGWWGSLAEALRAAWDGKDGPLIIDVSMLRERGALLKSFGGVSSGPGPLVVMLNNVAEILNSKVNQKLTSLDFMNIDHQIAACVVSGNIRRSARMSIKHWADPDIFEFIRLKRTEKDGDEKKHWSTNISVEVDDAFFRALRKGDQHASKVLNEVADGMHRDGEPGFWNSSLSAVGEIDYPFTTNPCLTGDMPVITDKGIIPIGLWAEEREARKVWDGQKWIKAKPVVTGRKPVVRLTLSNGAVLKATADHRIGTKDGGEVAAGEAQGEAVDFMSVPQVDLGEIDPHMVCVGFVQGDGSFHKASNRWKYVYIGERDDEVREYLTKNGVQISRDESEEDRPDRHVIYKLSSHQFKDWLMPVPLKERSLLQEVMQLPPDKARSFLRGLYSANGSVIEKYGRVTLKTACRKLAADVQTMLTLFGIRSYVTTNAEHEVTFPNGTYVCSESYDLNIASEDVRRFRETIGFIQTYKNESLDRMIEKIKVGRRPPVTVLSADDAGIEDVFDFQMEETHWASVNGFRVHNCGEIAFGPWDVCCLGHINLERFANRDAEAREAFRLMTRFLVRATFGDIMNPLQKEVINKNRRIGVGFFGFHPWLVYQGVRFSESHHKKHIREKLKNFHDVCRQTANDYSFQLRIPAPIKVTCVAPTGTISNLPGTTSGCQPVFAKHFIRRVVYAKDNPQIEKIRAQGYRIEEYIYDNKNSVVAEFPCKDPLVASCERRGVDASLAEEQSEISVSDHLAVQAMLQDEFADNCISYTINFDPTIVTVDDIKAALRVHLPHLKGTTMMPEVHGRPQSPFERISKEDFEKSGIGKVSDAERACSNGSCPIK